MESVVSDGLPFGENKEFLGRETPAPRKFEDTRRSVRGISVNNCGEQYTYCVRWTGLPTFVHTRRLSKRLAVAVTVPSFWGVGVVL